MSDPLRTDEQRPIDPASSDADRAAKIEQLLLVGLEHYFAAQYDQAINVWTRALFLDRAHARARAYIERARSAQAERQREGEELLQRGVHALGKGEIVEARRLLRDAMDQGAPSEEALAVLERLNRVDQVSPSTPPDGVRQRLWLDTSATTRSRPSPTAWAMLIVLGLIIVGSAAFAVGAFRANVPKSLERPSADVAPAGGADADRFAVPRRSERALARAQALMRSGRWREALAPLESIKPTDREKAEADRLRADIQKQLVGLARPDLAP